MMKMMIAMKAMVDDGRRKDASYNIVSNIHQVHLRLKINGASGMCKSNSPN